MVPVCRILFFNSSAGEFQSCRISWSDERRCSLQGGNVGKMDWAYRGGIDRVQFHPVSFDSLLLMNRTAM